MYYSHKRLKLRFGGGNQICTGEAGRFLQSWKLGAYAYCHMWGRSEAVMLPLLLKAVRAFRSPPQSGELERFAFPSRLSSLPNPCQ